MSIDLHAAADSFDERFGAPPTHFGRAPGRVNLIGEHTDYNGGFVLPMAIERDTLMLARTNGDSILRLYAANLDRNAEVSINQPERNLDEPWSNYVAGVVHEANACGLPIRGADILITGDVPLGCGLSSSASLEMSALALLEALAGRPLEDRHAAELGQRVENDFLGLASGIMDQFVSRAAKADHALFLELRSSAPVSGTIVAGSCASCGTAHRVRSRLRTCRRR